MAMPRDFKPQRLERDVIRHLGWTSCFGVLIPWLMSGLMGFRPWFFFGCLAAFFGSRFAFRKLRPPVVVEWSWRDWVWAGLAVVITMAYASGLTPRHFARLIGM